MSDYVRQDDFAARDALTTGDANKTIFGADIDTELDAVATASATKEDSANKNQANGYCGLDAGGLVLPSDLPAATTTAVGVLETATDAEMKTGTATDKIGTPANVTALLTEPPAIGATTAGTGAFSVLTAATSLEVGGVAVALQDVDIIAGTGLTGGGLISASRTLNVIGGIGIDATANDVRLNITTLAEMTAAVTATDDFLIADGSTMKKMNSNQIALHSTNDSGAHTFTSADVGGIRYFTGTSATWSMPSGIGQDDCFLIIVNSGSGTITLAGTTATVNSGNGLLDIPSGGIACMIRESSTVWFAGGTLE